MFEVCAQRKAGPRWLGAGSSMQIHRHEGGVHFGRGSQPQRFTRQHGRLIVAHLLSGKVGVVLKTRWNIAVAIWQRNPQLGCMHLGGLAFFGVRNAPPGRHQVDLPRANNLLAAQAVAVQHFAVNHPGEGLQANMGVRANLHAGRWWFGRACMVQKAPGSDFAQGALGNGSVDGDAAHIGDTGGKAL